MRRADKGMSDNVGEFAHSSMLWTTQANRRLRSQPRHFRKKKIMGILKELGFLEDVTFREQFLHALMKKKGYSEDDALLIIEASKVKPEILDAKMVGEVATHHYAWYWFAIEDQIERFEKKKKKKKKKEEEAGKCVSQ